MYGRRSETAIAALSRLAEAYDQEGARLSASDIADSRGLQRPIVAKVLSTLSRSGLVSGSPGPGGGYRLAREPRDISLYEVVLVFERDRATRDEECEFGKTPCSPEDPCRVHKRLGDAKRAWLDLLKDTTIEDFRRSG